MHWDDVRLFLALARSPRLGSAARRVGQDATTVSRRIQRLEQGLQATLFERTPGGYVLTERGQLLLAQAEAMEAAALDIQQGAGNDAGTLSGPIRLSVSEGFGSRILGPRLAQFTGSFPAVHIDLIASTGFLNPSRREADLAVMLARPKSGPLVARKLTDYRLGLYAHGHYLGSAPPLREVGDLIRHRLIGYVPDLIYAPELRYLAEIDTRLEASICSSSINAQAELIAARAGCGILPCFIGDTLPGVVRALPEIDIERNFWLVVHREARKIARIDRFVSWLDAVMAELRPVMLGAGGSGENR